MMAEREDVHAILRQASLAIGFCRGMTGHEPCATGERERLGDRHRA